MDEILLARWQFGITTVYHFIFVPLSIGLAPLVALFQTFYYRTKDPAYDELARFFGKLFIIIFTLGIVTGIVQEFQFGMNWSSYSRFVGDIFGIPLAVEALLAFFLESTFLGLWVFGRNRLPNWLHLLSIWLVAIGSMLSALFILMANSWMQEPVGYILRNGRAELQDVVAIALNERLFVQAPHTIMAGLLTGAMFVVGISGWHLLKTHRAEVFGKSMRIALVVATLTAVAMATTGHVLAQHTAKTQPMKLAAMEALWDSEKPASFSLFAVIDQKENRSTREIKLPYLLSVLAHNNVTDEVQGINDLQKAAEAQHGPGDYVPPVFMLYWGFRAMVGLGMLFIGFGFFGLLLWWLGKLDSLAWYHRLSVTMIFLPFIANSAGWIVTEMGRQPWVVYGLLLTRDGVSPLVSGSMIWISMVGFTVIYAVLALAGAYLIYRWANPSGYKPPAAPDPDGVPSNEDLSHAY